MLHTTRMSLAALVAFPAQSEIYTACTKGDDEIVLEDLRRHGQRDPIIVMPEGNKAGLPYLTILDGHRRRELMQVLGWTEADVLIREDLLDADLQTVTAEFLRYNLVRRQLHPIDKARAVAHLFMTQEHGTLKRLGNLERGKLKDELARVVGMGPRELSRYLNLLETPLEVQTAVRDRRLKLVLGCRVTFLPEDKQEELADRIAAAPATEKVNELVKQHVETPEVRNRRRVSDDVRSLARHLENASSALSGRMAEVTPDQAMMCMPVFKKGVELIQKLMRKAS